MIAALIVLALGGFGFAGVAVALAIRQAGLRELKAELVAENAALEEAYIALTEEHEISIERHESELEIYRDELRQLEREWNALPDNPDNRRIVLARLDRLLQGKAGKDDHDYDHRSGLPGESESPD